jgi:hypothetical protein
MLVVERTQVLTIAILACHFLASQEAKLKLNEYFPLMGF